MNGHIHADHKPTYDDVNPENLVGVQIEKGNLQDVEDIFDYDKDSSTIQKELEEFEKNGEDESVSEGFGFDDFGDDEESIGEDTEDVISSDEEQVDDRGDVEDYFDSAEFVIFITEIIIVFGTNFYLKYNKLDKISIKDFDKTAGQQKLLVKSWAKVLHKHNAKVSPEMELLFALGSAYGMKISSIVDKQKAKKYDEMIKAQKEGAKAKVGKAKVVKTPKKKDNKEDISPAIFDVDFSNVEEVPSDYDDYQRDLIEQDNLHKEIQAADDKHKAKEKSKKPSKGLIDLT